MTDLKQQGFTLIEIMAAVLISSILMLGAMQMFINTKQTYDLQSQMAKMQNNARFIMDELTREIRMAGYFGCNATPPVTTAATPITVTELLGTTDGTTPITINDKPYPASDTLVINSIAHQRFVIDENTDFTAGSQKIILEPSSIWPQDGDDVIIRDCTGEVSYVVDGNPSIPTATTTTNPSANAEVDFTSIFDSTVPSTEIKYTQPIDIFIGPLAVAYMVEPTPDGELALYRCYDNSSEIGTTTFCQDTDDKELLVRGVMNMQIRYGIDTDPPGTITNPEYNIPNFYTTPRVLDLTANERLVSVRITLLMRTPERRFDFKTSTQRSFKLDPDLDTSDTSWGVDIYDPRIHNPSIERAYRHRLFTTVVGVRQNIYN